MTLGWWRWLVIVHMACGVLLAAPASASDPAAVVELKPGRDAPPLSPYIRYTKDIGGYTAPIERVWQLPLKANPAGVEHFGPPGKRTVTVLRFRNAGTGAGSSILTTGRGSLSHFRLYELSRSGLELVLDAGNPAAAQNNLMTYQAFSQELLLSAGEEKTMVVDFLSENSTYMPLRLETYGTFFQDRRANVAMVAGVVLAVAVLVFLNVVFFSVTGHREFGWLALAQTFLMISTIHTEGYLTIFFLADNPLLSVAIEDGIKCAFAAAMAQFARSFLKTPVRFPRLDKALLALIAAGAVISVLQFGLSIYGTGVRTLIHSLAWVLTGVVALLLPVGGFLAMRSIGLQLWPLLVGWASLALFIIYGAMPAKVRPRSSSRRGCRSSSSRPLLCRLLSMRCSPSLWVTAAPSWPPALSRPSGCLP